MTTSRTDENSLFCEAKQSGSIPPMDRRIVPQLDLHLPLESQIRNCWETSISLLKPFCDRLAQREGTEVIETIGISGSFARREATAGSDLDLIVIARDEADPEKLGAIEERLRKLIADCSLKGPGSRGIFLTPLECRELFDPPLGEIEESPRTFGTRIQLLLDAQPLWGVERFRRLQRSVLQRYLTPAPESDREECWSYLLHDLSRYFRSLALKYQWEDRGQTSRWRLRNVKGWFSRPLMQIALLTLLRASLDKGRDPEAWVSARLHLTPLERLAESASIERRELLRQIVSVYSEFLNSLSAPELRDRISGQDFQGFRRQANHFHDLLIQLLLEESEDRSREFRRRLFF